jgi:hypothetical protein
MKNWKTTGLGAVTLLYVIVKAIINGGLDATDLPLLTTGMGLIAAKDSNVTGGSVAQ